MNSRNADYIMRYNQRKDYPKADSKILTKTIAQKAGIKVPELYAAIHSVGDLRNLNSYLREIETFVIKPEHGAGGEGVLVLSKDEDGVIRDSNSEIVEQGNLKHHISNILSGLYSLGGQPDSAMIEYKIDFDAIFDPISFRGVPDIRIIVLQGVPVMCMLRLPTKDSGGKANLHQGAIGVGVDVATGVTMGGVQKNGAIDRHPDTGNPIAGFCVPHWNEILEMAARGTELFSLGYLGMDIVLDKKFGPMLLEVNVRPGLAVQLANRTPLKHRLRTVEKNYQELPTAKERIAFAKQYFASEVGE